MSISADIYERRSLFSVYKTIQTIIGVGLFANSLISLLVNLLKMTEKEKTDKD